MLPANDVDDAVRDELPGTEDARLEVELPTPCELPDEPRELETVMLLDTALVPAIEVDETRRDDAEAEVDGAEVPIP